MKKFIYIPFLCLCVMTLMWSCAKDDASASPTNATGQGGSLAQFSIIDDYLYVVDNEDLRVLDISDAAQPNLVHEQQVGFGIETLFHHGDHLFIGSQSGMFIYDISNKAQPTFVSDYQHLEACDPVVANDTVAFVTLRSGRQCEFRNDLNVLDVLDISDINDPYLLRSYELNNPSGLGLMGSTLFVCDGQSGLAIFDVSIPQNINLIHTIDNINVHDVIVVGNRILLIGPENLYQYDMSNPLVPVLLSTLDIVNF